MLDTFLNALKVNAFVIVLTIVVGFIIAKLIMATVSYTHLTLPTNREV